MPISLRRMTIATGSLGDIRQLIYLGSEKSKRSVTYDLLCTINILTYLLTYLHPDVTWIISKFINLMDYTFGNGTAANINNHDS